MGFAHVSFCLVLLVLPAIFFSDHVFHNTSKYFFCQKDVALTIAFSFLPEKHKHVRSKFPRKFCFPYHLPESVKALVLFLLLQEHHLQSFYAKNCYSICNKVSWYKNINNNKVQEGPVYPMCTGLV